MPAFRKMASPAYSRFPPPRAHSKPFPVEQVQDVSRQRDLVGLAEIVSVRFLAGRIGKGRRDDRGLKLPFLGERVRVSETGGHLPWTVARGYTFW